MSPHILIDNHLDELGMAGCPPDYEAVVLLQMTKLYTSEAISLEEFNHYCRRLTDTLARRPGRAA